LRIELTGTIVHKHEETAAGIVAAVFSSNGQDYEIRVLDGRLIKCILLM